MARASRSQTTQPARSLAAALAGFDDERLIALLTARPDLAQVRPANFDQLAARVSTWPSAQACFDTLDQTHRRLLEAMCLMPTPTCAQQLATFLDPSLDAAVLAAPFRRLEDLALILIDGGRDVWINPAFKQLRYPAGLGPPAESLLGGFPGAFLVDVAKRLGLRPERTKGATLGVLATALCDAGLVGRTVDAGPPGTAALVDRLAAGPPVVTVAGSYYNASDRTPHGWLTNRGLLVHPGWGEAFMPGEVGLALRGGVMFPGFSLHRPAPRTTIADQPGIDAAAAGAALRLVSDLALLIADWEVSPPKVLKSGGLGVRDVRRAAAATGRSEADAARIIELAVLAGVAGPDQAGAIVLPTSRFDQWLAAEPGPRWAAVVDAWQRGGHHLSAALDPSTAAAGAARPLLSRFSSRAPDQRRAVLDAFAELPPGQAADPEDLVAAATWARPALWRGARAGSAADAGTVVAEAELIGVGTAGCFSTAGRLAASGRLADAGQAFTELAPAVVSEFTVQADLTAVAAGTLAPAVRAELDLLADVESTGVATVFRFSPSSLVRAFEAGRTAEQISAWLTEHARNQVPQPLAYLIGDLGRRYGRLRVGAIATYLRSDDPSLTAEVLRARAASGLALRELAPGVLVSPAKPAKVVTVLRAAGYLPAHETADGRLMIIRPVRPRAPGPATAGHGKPRPDTKPRPPGAATDAKALVAALRRAPPPRVVPTGPAGPAPDLSIADRPPGGSKNDLAFDDLEAILIELGMDVDEYLAEVGDDGPSRPRPTGIVKDPAGIRDLLDLAVDEDWGLRADYVNSSGQGRQLTFHLVEVGVRKLKAEVSPHWTIETLAVDRIQWARVLTEAEEDAL